MMAEMDLVRAAQDGSTSAFTALVEQYQERLFRFLLGRCGSPADAEDLTQDTFVNAFRFIKSFDGRAKFSTWLYTIAVRLAAGKARKAGREVLTDPDISIEDDAAGPQERADADETRSNLWDLARELLGEEQYTLLWLRYVEDMPLKAIGDAMDRSVPWVKINHMRARRTMEKALKGRQELLSSSASAGHAESWKFSTQSGPSR